MKLPQQFVARGKIEPEMQKTLQNMWEELVFAINSLDTNGPSFAGSWYTEDGTNLWQLEDGSGDWLVEG